MGLQRGATALQVGWMTPQAYASARRAETGLAAPDSHGRALGPIATHDSQGSNQPRTLTMAG
jgi:putative transposase